MTVSTHDVTDTIGTLNWACQTGGRLSRSERNALMRQAVTVQAHIMTNEISPANLARVDLNRILIPDSQTARHAESLIAELGPQTLVNHCYRTYFWGCLLAQYDDTKISDLESFYVACLLHDLGLTEAHFCRNAQCHCFAVEGALAADTFLLNEGWEKTRRDVIAEAITLHLNMLIQLEQGPIAYYLSSGAKCDVVGARVSDVPQTILRQVLQQHPGLDFGAAFAVMLATEAHTRPESRTALIVQNFPLEALFPLENSLR